MPKVIRTHPARDDLTQIWCYVAQHSVSAADRLIDRFERTLLALARNPLIGESAEQFRAGLRRFTVNSYVLYYEPIADGVRLIRVLHGSQQADDRLR